MKAMALRSGSPANLPGTRLGLAFAASLVLHAVLLFPPGFAPPPPLSVAPKEPLAARLAAPALATHPEEEPAAVPPAPTFAKKKPKPLAGRALDTALAALTREEFYPREAIERGLEGRVVLLLTLDVAGAVTAVEVASGSGHAILDAAAVQAAGRIGALPGGGRQALLPVEFRLE